MLKNAPISIEKKIVKMKGDCKIEDGHMKKESKENQETYDDEIFNVVSSVVQWYLVLEQVKLVVNEVWIKIIRCM